jgi:hypothetical protein
MKTGDLILYLAIVVPWVIGIAIAKGFWMVLGCVVLAPMAWVLTAQHFLGLPA